HLIDETRRSLRLHHPHIVRIYDFVQDENCAGITMEFIDGETLSNLRIENAKRVFEVAEIGPWVGQLCDVLSYAHEEAMVAHRDLKPANLMLTKRGHLKVTDFGISRSLSDTMTRRTMAAQGASGTLVYMSPQQALGDAVSALDDIYSLGATVYELLTSKPPFYTGEILTQVREKTAPSMSSRRAELGLFGDPIPREWEETIAACLSKDPALRPQSARAVKEQLGLANTESKVFVTGGPIKLEPSSPPPTTAVTYDSPPRTNAWPTKEYQRVVVSSEHRRKSWMVISAAMGLTLFFMWMALRASRESTEAGAAPASVVLNSVPPGAEVYMRGNRIGVTPFSRPITSGRAILEFRIPGYYPTLITTNLPSGRSVRLEPQMERLRGSVEVKIAPAGAELRLDGQVVQPGIVRAEFGKHQLEVVLAGHKTVSREIELKDESIVELGTIALEPILGSLEFLATPVGAAFEVTGARGVVHKGLITPEVMSFNLPIGEYSVTFTAEGHVGTNFVVRVTEKQSVRLDSVQLTQLVGSLHLTGEPAGATYELTGASTRNGRLPVNFEKLPAGKYRLTVGRDGFDTQVREIVVGEGQVVTEEFSLSRSRGDLRLGSQPEPADFEISGSGVALIRGRTPTVVPSLPTGEYQLRLVYKQHVLTNRIVVASGSNAPVTVDFPVGRIRVDSVPANALVLIGGVEMGRTPLEIPDLNIGMITAELRLPGYRYTELSGSVVTRQTNVFRTVLKRFDAPQSADKVWTNSIGMRFVPVGNVWMSVWETRVRDFTAFQSAARYNAGSAWSDPGFDQTPNHPVVNVNWDDAQSFCRWMTEKESRAGMIPGFEYRLPTDQEWSRAIGIDGETATTPAERERQGNGAYLWGAQWPPPVAIANLHGLAAFDSFETTSPVGSFRPNRYGIFDLVGNAWEWCVDPYDSTGQFRVLRGESWQPPMSGYRAAYRRFLTPTQRSSGVGFRCVLVPVGTAVK
ncbi:MAG TPA: bifunctional serine/threonine-protein kinase/formylglycine-generating enzyme family protein, partial [Roseimicrobium sp.]|nr:bifunctional serine/threonine-protein kinase/formylglycine-generating enzyme family protein [Roseimicrobium sp.]